MAISLFIKVAKSFHYGQKLYFGQPYQLHHQTLPSLYITTQVCPFVFHHGKSWTIFLSDIIPLLHYLRCKWTFALGKWTFLYHHLRHIHYDIVLTFTCQKTMSINEATHYANRSHPILIYNNSTNTQQIHIGLIQCRLIHSFEQVYWLIVILLFEENTGQQLHHMNVSSKFLNDLCSMNLQRLHSREVSFNILDLFLIQHSFFTLSNAFG